MTQQPSLTPCANSGCNRPAGAADMYTGFCANCYVTAAASPPRDVIGHVAMATQQVRQVLPPSCIMDFCSNEGSAECKGLCQQCFSALCQTRLQTAFDPVTNTTSATAPACKCA